MTQILDSGSERSDVLVVGSGRPVPRELVALWKGWYAVRLGLARFGGRDDGSGRGPSA